ncbi:MAG: hypothetical protein AAB655_01310 [Patescibacteria group bacterium]
MNMGGKVITILLMVVFLGAGLYFVRSGTIGKLTSFGLRPFSTSTVATSGGGFVSTSTYWPQTTPYVKPPQQVFLPATTTKINSYDIPKGFTEADLSPYFKKISIGSLSPGSIYSYGTVSLKTSFSTNEAINVTGWVLRANRGSQIIPRAVDIYDPSGLAPERDIFLRKYDYLYIYSTTSAIGKNLRLNKCVGYLENYNKFTPSLPRSCPYVNRSEISYLSGKCQDYILSLGGCRLPASSPPIPATDYDACRAYLDTINYKGCFDKYRVDADFFSHEYRAWSGSRFLDERHDKVLLLDRDGLLVDLREY